jgi:hypothetical protein
LEAFVSFQDGSYFTGSAYIDQNIGANVTNAYFLALIWSATTPCLGPNSSTSVIDFSDRFSLSSLNATFSQPVIDGLKTVADKLEGPDPKDGYEPLKVSGTTTASPSHTIVLSAGAAAGIAVVGLLLLLGIPVAIAFCLRRQRRRQIRQNPRHSRVFPEGALKAQLDDTAVNKTMSFADNKTTPFPDNKRTPFPDNKRTPFPDNRPMPFAEIHELQANEIIRELDGKTWPRGAVEMNAGIGSNRHELEGPVK